MLSSAYYFNVLYCVWFGVPSYVIRPLAYQVCVVERVARRNTCNVVDCLLAVACAGHALVGRRLLGVPGGQTTRQTVPLRGIYPWRHAVLPFLAPPPLALPPTGLQELPWGG